MEEQEVAYFFDTYAIIEILKQNPNYERYSNLSPTFTIFNLAEIYYSVLKDYGVEKAKDIYEDYKTMVVEINDSVLQESMHFRYDNKKKDISYSDSIGYTYAKKNNMKFLTGDKEFEDLENVEFVK